MTVTMGEFALLREPFKPESVGKLPRVTCKDCSDRAKTCSKHQKSKCNVCGSFISSAHIHLDYVGHAEVTDRLLTVDPAWSWEPCAFNEHGLPAVGKGAGGESILWIRLTILGVTRLGVGSVAPNAFDSEKQLIGDAIRNAAMRFGVALDLWAKEELESSVSTPSGVDTSTGEIVGGGDAGRTPPPAAPPTNNTRRPPPGRARAEKGDPPAQATSSAGSTASDQAGPVVTTAPPTITPAALDSLRALAARKGLDDADMEKMAGKEFGTIGTLTEPESQALTQLIVKFKQTPGEVGLPPETAKAE